jgi:hypothetical protein
MAQQRVRVGGGAPARRDVAVGAQQIERRPRATVRLRERVRAVGFGIGDAPRTHGARHDPLQSLRERLCIRRRRPHCAGVDVDICHVHTGRLLEQQQRKASRIVQVVEPRGPRRAAERPVDHMHERIGRTLARPRPAVEHALERERAFPVLDAQLAERAAHRVAHRPERREQRHDVIAQQLDRAVVGFDHLRDETGLPQHVALDRMALRVIGVEQPLGRAGGEHARELPAEIERFLHPRIHPLRTGRAVNVRGIAREKHAAVA